MVCKWIIAIISRFTWVALALVGLALAWRAVIVSASTSSQAVQTQVAYGTEPAPKREGQIKPDSPDISFIDSPNPTCYRPVKGTNACFIRWYYQSVSAGSSQYIISMTVAIDGHIRAYYSGFFQNSMYIPYDLSPNGFGVDCGTPGSAGVAELGESYTYTIRSRDTQNLSSANYGTVFCPADVVLIDHIDLTGPETGFVNTSYAFTADLFPVTTTLPVTYTWTASGFSPQTTLGGLTTTRSFSWNHPGVMTVTLEAQNLGNSMSKTVSINIQPRFIYLPFTRRR